MSNTEHPPAKRESGHARENGSGPCSLGLPDLIPAPEPIPRQPMEKVIDGIIHAISLIFEARDPYTASHQRRVAVLSRDAALGHGASGVVARASGVDLDLRRDDPTLPYPGFEVPVADAGDAAARIGLLAAEVGVSVGLVRWAVAALAGTVGEPVSVRLPRVVRVPEGTTYTWTENPGGINGYLLVSRNERTPWRLKLRSAGFGNASALGAALVGTAVADLPAAVASFPLVCGDIDR